MNLWGFGVGLPDAAITKAFAKIHNFFKIKTGKTTAMLEHIHIL
jgi:hypothetical protein